MNIFLVKKIIFRQSSQNQQHDEKKTIKPNEILLLDDDVQNILVAEEFGHKVLEIRDEINLDILKDFVYNILPAS